MVDGVDTWPAPSTRMSHAPMEVATSWTESSCVTSTTWIEVDSVGGSVAAVSLSATSARPRSAMWAAPAIPNAAAVSRPMPLPCFGGGGLISYISLELLMLPRSATGVGGEKRGREGQQQQQRQSGQQAAGIRKMAEQEYKLTAPVMTTVLPTALSSGLVGEMAG